MANQSVTTKSGNTIQVTFEGTGGDWSWSTHGGFVGGGIKVKTIMWHPTADSDVLVINDAGADNASIVHAEASDSGVTPTFTFGEGEWMKPYIDIDDQTFGTPTGTKIIFVIA